MYQHWRRKWFVRIKWQIIMQQHWTNEGVCLFLSAIHVSPSIKERSKNLKEQNCGEEALYLSDHPSFCLSAAGSRWEGQLFLLRPCQRGLSSVPLSTSVPPGTKLLLICTFTLSLRTRIIPGMDIKCFEQQNSETAIFLGRLKKVEPQKKMDIWSTMSLPRTTPDNSNLAKKVPERLGP